MERTRCSFLRGMRPTAAILTTFFVSSAVGGCVGKQVITTAEQAYLCDGGITFAVAKSGDGTQVRFADAIYSLRRGPSSVGERFSSDDATLIIDHPSAVFIANDRLGLRACRAVRSDA